MTSPKVASPAAVNKDPVAQYPAANPATAPTVPNASASPNRARHAPHHPPVPACAPLVAPPPWRPPAGAFAAAQVGGVMLPAAFCLVIRPSLLVTELLPHSR